MNSAENGCVDHSGAGAMHRLTRSITIKHRSNEEEIREENASPNDKSESTKKDLDDEDLEEEFEELLRQSGFTSSIHCYPPRPPKGLQRDRIRKKWQNIRRGRE